MESSEIESWDTARLLSVLLQDSADVSKAPGPLLLKRFPHLDVLARLGSRQLKEIEQLDSRQVQKLQAAFELGWRTWMKPEPLQEPYQCSAQIFRAFRHELCRESVEVVWLLLLDTRLRQIAAFEIARGALNGAIVHPREVLHHVITQRAAAFILMHNHPSGDPTPSAEDLTVTRKLLRLSNLLGVDFLDHVIFAAQGYYSLCDRGRMCRIR